MLKAHCVFGRLALMVFVFGGCVAEGQTISHRTFEKIQLTDEYYSEGADVGDFNGDGVGDVVSGPYWYEGPGFDVKHEIYPPVPQNRNSYALDNFFSFVHDFNKDGFEDVVTYGLPGTPAFLYLNPGPGQIGEHWGRHQVFDWVSNESPDFTDLTGDGQPEIVCTRAGKFGYATYDASQPAKPWVFHAISKVAAHGKFGHGLGIGDVNGDGLRDVISQKGWYQQPSVIEEGKLWEFHAYLFTQRGGAQMYAYDVDGDGDNDVITSIEAHGYGLAWFEHVSRGGRIDFVKHTIMTDKKEDNDYGVAFSELHAVELKDVDGDGLKDIVTGKTYWSHHEKTPSWNDGAVVYWFKLVRDGGKIDWVPHQADDDSGVGRQVVVKDVSGDGKLDFITGNMKGAFVLVQKEVALSQAEYEKVRPKRTVTGAKRVAASTPAPAKVGASGYAAGWPKGLLPVGADGKALNLDFETGDFSDWTSSGSAFAKNALVKAASAEGNQGTGSYSVSSGGGDEKSVGTLTSKPFKIDHIYASFLVGGGKTKATRVEFVNAETGKAFYSISGAENNRLRPVFYDIRHVMGREIYIRLVDESTGEWGHIGFDDFRFYDKRPAFPVPLHQAVPAPLDQYANAGLKPEEAAKAMAMPEGFSASLFAGEPDIIQPIAMAIDHRGRLWVAEAYSYPIKLKAEDARDRILVFEDTDNDGKFDKRTVFIDKLNLVSGLEVGHGGVWVGQAPELLFIPDADGDDVPDSAPQVVLDGWGYQDTHETLNSFIWGPDGWLYGCQGVFTHSLVGKPGTADDERVPLNACIWRYHPTTKKFEVFAEGGSNQWGVDFNDFGQAFMTACVIPHLYHVVQNGRFLRQAGSHFNPYTYDDIKTIADHQHWVGNRPHAGNNRSAEVGGGHAHAGAMVYLGGTWPEQYRNQIFMNNIHGARLNVDALNPVGSGFSGAHSTDFLKANDSWSQIVNLRYGPDGNVFLIDWYDQAQCHRRDPTVHDRTNGRVFKVTYGESKPLSVDLTKNTDAELVQMQMHENDWYVRHSRRVLQERADAGTLKSSTHRLLVELAESTSDAKRHLRVLWTLHVTGGLTDELAGRFIQSENEYVRAWTIQLVCEDGNASSQQVATFAKMAKSETSAVVRLYLASALGQLPVDQRWGIAENLVKHGADADDFNIPLVLWYGVEPLVEVDAGRALSMAGASKIPTVTKYITRRAASDDASLPAVLAELGMTKGAAAQNAMLDQVIIALSGRVGVPMPKNWGPLYDKLSASEDVRVRASAQYVAVQFGDSRVFPMLRKTLSRVGEADISQRLRALEILLNGKDPELAWVLPNIIDEPKLRGPAIRAMAAYQTKKTADVLMSRYEKFNDEERRDAMNTLASRPTYAVALLGAVKAGEIPRAALTAFIVRQMHSFNDSKVNALLTDVWGDVRATSADKKKLIARYTALMTPERLKLANLPEGRALFANTCMACHKFFDVGAELGPDITGSNRADLAYILENILDPNAVIGKDYQMTLVQTKDDRFFSGMVKAESDSAITVQMLNEQNVIAKADIVKRETLPMSLMPEGQMTAMTDDQAVNLIAYLASQSQSALPGQKINVLPKTGRVQGALEGEALDVQELTGGKTSVQQMGKYSPDVWSGNAQLFWTGGKPNDMLTFIFPKRSKGIVDLQLVLTKAKDYPIVQLYLNKEPIGEPIDLYSSKVETTGVIPLGNHDLSLSWQSLGIKILGANEKAAKGYRVGIDYLRMIPAR